LAKLTEQRDIHEVAAECDVVFTDNTAKIPGDYVDDPFKSALEAAREDGITCLAVFGDFFLKVKPNATWMQALRLYQELRIQDYPKNQR